MRRKKNDSEKPEPIYDLKIFLGMIAVLIIPAWLALRTVQDPGQSFFLSDPTSVSDPVAAIQDQIQKGKISIAILVHMVTPGVCPSFWLPF